MGGAQELAFLTGSQVLLTLLVQAAHLGDHRPGCEDPSGLDRVYLSSQPGPGDKAAIAEIVLSMVVLGGSGDGREMKQLTSYLMKREGKGSGRREGVGQTGLQTPRSTVFSRHLGCSPLKAKEKAARQADVGGRPFWA